MKQAKLSFDYLFYYICSHIPVLGEPVKNYYTDHAWFKRFAKFGSSTLVMYWLLKGPLLWVLTLTLPSVNLLLFVIPSYVMAGFLAGLIVTVIGFVVNEVWVWKIGEKKK